MREIFEIICVIFIAAFWLMSKEKAKIRQRAKERRPNYIDQHASESAPSKDDAPLPIVGAYQKKWLLTYNEKDAFKKIKAVTDEIGCYTFSKVRLLDLLEPVKGNPKYKTYFYKVQAKHVDFVILDEKLVARCAVELDDASHDAEDRKKRDAFVDEVLQSVGYRIIHTRAVTEEVQQQIREIMKT